MLWQGSEFSRWQRRVKYKRNKRTKTGAKQDDAENDESGDRQPEMGCVILIVIICPMTLRAYSTSIPPMPKPMVAPEIPGQSPANATAQAF